MKASEERKGLPGGMKARELLDLYFLDIRCHLLEAAAVLDRIERAQEGREAMADARVVNLLEALDLLKEPGADRARRFLMLFSESPGKE